MPKLKVQANKNVREKDKAIVLKYVDLCLKEICKKEHEINTVFRSPIKIQQARDNLLIKIRHSGLRARGGKQHISIDTSIFSSIVEYSSFAHDPVIGSMRCKSREKALAAVVAHELAHHVQYRYGPYTRWLKSNYKKPHGEGFQAIYRILRSRIVNPIPDPKLEEEAA